MGEEMTVEQFTKNLVKLIQDPTGPSPEVAEHLLAEALRTARQRGAEEAAQTALRFRAKSGDDTFHDCPENRLLETVACAIRARALEDTQ